MNKQELLRTSDGYINATLLCKLSNKRIDRWKESPTTKKLIEKVCIKYNLSRDKIIESYQGGKNKGGTWIHPDLGVHLGQWCSPDFCLKIADWIDEWKKYKIENEEKFETELINIKPSDVKTNLERLVQKKLQKLLGGEIEVETPCGYIDLLTSDSIIEIKNFYNWKYALGQILAYSNFYTEHKKVIYFFKEDEEEYDEKVIKIIKNIYEKYDINIMFD
jgi:hypothetical protein